VLSPGTINPFTLPSVTLNDRHKLPDAPGVYFAIGKRRAVLYIGKAGSLRKRWTRNHDRLPLLEYIGGVRLAYLIADVGVLTVLEPDFIKRYRPRFNYNHQPVEKPKHQPVVKGKVAANKPRPSFIPRVVKVECCIANRAGIRCNRCGGLVKQGDMYSLYYEKSKQTENVCLNGCGLPRLLKPKTESAKKGKAK
jgi:hypothetical protein